MRWSIFTTQKNSNLSYPLIYTIDKPSLFWYTVLMKNIPEFPLCIRYATVEDIPLIKKIASHYPAELGFVRIPSLLESIQRHSLLVAETDSIVGFVNFYRRRDGIATVYDIAAHPGHTHENIGTFLINAVPHPIQLKCTEDNTPAINFYLSNGFSFVQREQGRKKALHKYYKPRRIIMCKGSSIAAISGLDCGWIYGTRHTEKPVQQPFFVDIQWEEYDWLDYCHKLSLWRPVMAMAPDLLDRSQVPDLYKKIRDLKSLGVLEIGVCPKFEGAVRFLPSWITVCVSIPSSYAGYLPPKEELNGRRVHLLGGSPRRQLDFIQQHENCIVSSLDMNYHTKASGFGALFNGERCRWEIVSKEEKLSYADKILINAQSIAGRLLS